LVVEWDNRAVAWPRLVLPQPRALWLGESVTSVFTTEALEQVLEQTAGYRTGYERLEAGKALQAAGRVTGAKPAYLGVTGTVQDERAEHRVWVGIRQWMLVGECDCPDTDPLASVEEHLAAVAAGQAETAGPCVHAVALALAGIAQRLPWAAPPQEPQPGTGRGPRTTPPPPLNITSVFPELAGFARQAVRLHPRRGQPGPRDSSMGGPLLWPAAEPWPVCTHPHSGNWEWADVPREITSFEEARAWGRATLGPQARVGSAWRGDDGGPAQVVIDRSRPPEIPSPMISVLQLHARDVPGLPFPQGTDCLQFLWCPNHHRPGRYPTVSVLQVAAFWRRAATVSEVLGSPPEPRFDVKMNARRYRPLPCLLNPEPVTEYPSYSHYPDYSDLPDPLRQRVARWDGLTAGLYTEVLSTAPGTKAGGYPRWIQEADWPVCGCGRRMDHLLTIASAEWGDRMRWIPPEDRDEAFASEHYEASFTRGRPTWSGWAPHDIQLGDIGSMYLFTCTTCQHRPLDGSVQMT
jgi:hypothetical protein